MCVCGGGGGNGESERKRKTEKVKKEWRGWGGRLENLNSVILQGL